MIIGNIKIEKVYYKNGDFWYFSYKDLDDPGYEYKEFVDGLRVWFFNGKRHRKEGPAYIHPDGTKIWFKNGEYHREDGPAIVYPTGSKWWCLENENYSEEEFYKKVNCNEIR